MFWFLKPKKTAEATPSVAPTAGSEGLDVEEEVEDLWSNDFEGRQLSPKVATAPIKKIVDDAEEDRAVYCSRFEPLDAKESAEYRTHSAAAYEIYVITTQGGEVLEVNQRVQHCRGAKRSFAPHEAPAHIFPPGAMFDLDWLDIAPSARARVVKLLSQITDAR